MRQYKKGDLLKGKVTGIETYGVFIALDDNYTGLIHISEVSNEFIKDIHELLKIGDKIFVKVIGVDNKKKNLKLSIKNINYKGDGKRIKRPIKESGTGFKKLEENLPIWTENKLREMLDK